MIERKNVYYIKNVIIIKYGIHIKENVENHNTKKIVKKMKYIVLHKKSVKKNKYVKMVN